MNKQELYVKLRTRFGDVAQTIVAIEELSELQKELCKWLRDSKRDITPIVEEIADVRIMIEQLQAMLGCDNCVEQIMKEKLQRTIDRYFK